MTDKELRRLSRGELLEMLIAQMEKNEQVQHELDCAREELRQRQLIMDKAGSIAEAALQMNHVFEAADEAAKQYLDSVKQMAGEGNGEV